MKCTAWTAIAVALFGATGVRAGAADDMAARIRDVDDLLNDWQLDEAASIAEKLDHELPDTPPVARLARRSFLDEDR